MTTYLDGILATHRARAASDTRGLDELEAGLRTTAPPREFLGALATPTAPIRVIAEIKRRSPSRGGLAPDLDPAVVARAYATGGAACLSVLTDVEYFGGSPADLIAARAAVELPVLRKDFTVSVGDLYDARAMGADAVLLIVAALSSTELGEFQRVATELDLAAIVEVHDEEELRAALRAGARCIGVNQRDLRTFEVDTERALKLRSEISEGVVSVAESGIKTAADLARLADAGYDAALVGEALVTAPDPSEALRELTGAAAKVKG